jgi:hypothetical protein
MELRDEAVELKFADYGMAANWEVFHDKVSSPDQAFLDGVGFATQTMFRHRRSANNRNTGNGSIGLGTANLVPL